MPATSTSTLGNIKTTDTGPLIRTLASDLVRSPEFRLRLLHSRIARCFARAEPRERALNYMLGLAGVSEEPPIGRRNVASYSQESRADGAQRLLTTAQWDDAEVRQQLREAVRAGAGAAGRLSIVEATFRKKGNHAVAVEHQHSPESGRQVNCQSAVLLLLTTSDQRQFLLDIELYVPPSWAADPDRRTRGGIPADLRYRSKSEIATEMVFRALQEGIRPQQISVSLQCAAKPKLLQTLQQHRVPYLAALTGREVEWLATNAADATAQRGRPTAVTVKCTSAAGPGGERRGAPGFYRAEAGQPLSAAEVNRAIAELRSGERRWQATRGEIRMDRYEVRSWRGWYRHMTLAMAVQLANELALTGGAVKG